MNDDDILATEFISLSEISSNLPDDRGTAGANRVVTHSEPGFLPVFGPAYVNFYGAPREFDMFPDTYAKAMNKGIGDGCSFRGRVLLEIASGPGEGFPKNPKGSVRMLVDT